MDNLTALNKELNRYSFMPQIKNNDDILAKILKK
jgi:hypothetical protein